MTVGKRENEKKRLAKREEKLKRKENRKTNKSSIDDMIAYVDEYGMISSTPPEENVKKREINLEEIMIATPKPPDRKRPRLTSSHITISYAVFCLKK